MKELKDAQTFEELLDIKYGRTGTKERDEFELKSKSFIIGEMLKETRKQAGISQEELARKTGTKKSYISRLENGKIDVQVSTLCRIFEVGLGRKVNLTLT
ncbi:MAG: helix-turn-helix transcriptional regulator [Candidatus Aminicenantes bacterium]|nr:helix-turn-helix transcriptional regulator [Candidatus Aminicenantes bacterium]